MEESEIDLMTLQVGPISEVWVTEAASLHALSEYPGDY